MTEFFSQAPMLPYYKYSGQNNLYSPRGYAQGTLVDLLSSRNLADETEEIIEGTTEQNQPAFEEVKDSDTQSFFGGMDINEGDNLSFDDLSDLSLTDGLFGGTTVSDNAPRGWNTQHQREFDALRAAGLKPSAKWTGNDWYVFAKELDGTPFGEPGSMTLSDTLTSGGKYGGQPMSLFGNVAGAVTGSFKPNEVFNKNLAEALSEKPGAATGGIQGDPSTILGTFDPTTEPTIEAPSLKDQQQAELVLKNTTSSDVKNNPALAAQVEEANKVLGVTAKRGGTVTSKEGGTVTAKRPTPAPKPKSVPLKEVIANAVAAAKQKEKDNRDQEKAARHEKEKQNRETVREKQKAVKGFSGGYGF